MRETDYKSNREVNNGKYLYKCNQEEKQQMNNKVHLLMNKSVSGWKEVENKEQSD